MSSAVRGPGLFPPSRLLDMLRVEAGQSRFTRFGRRAGLQAGNSDATNGLANRLTCGERPHFILHMILGPHASGIALDPSLPLMATQLL